MKFAREDPPKITMKRAVKKITENFAAQRAIVVAATLFRGPVEISSNSAFRADSEPQTFAHPEPFQVTIRAGNESGVSR